MDSQRGDAPCVPDIQATDQSDNSRLVAATERFLAQLEAGGQPSVDDYLAEYPDIAEQLQACLENLRLVHEIAPQLSQATVQQAPPAPQIHPLATVGDFRILQEIGRGGMGVVYAAEQLSLGRRVALKVLPFAAVMDGRQLQRFKNEAQAAAALHHTNIVPVYSVGCERGVHFYAMQFIEGQTLAEVIRALRQNEGLADDEKPQQRAHSPSAVSLPSSKLAQSNPAGSTDPTMDSDIDANSEYALDQGQQLLALAASEFETETSPIAAMTTDRSTKSPEYIRSIVRLGIQIAEALDFAHQQGVIHRDIKPSNIILDVTGRGWITDFGLARVEANPGLTMTGDIVGTLRYMSPEQALAKRVVVDHRTDIYSLGMTLYELLTLRPAFDGQDRQELLKQVAFEEPRLPQRYNRSIPTELQTILLKAIAKNPAERYDTAQDLADDLQRLLNHQPIRARRPSVRQRVAKWAVRHAAIVWSAAAILLVSTLALGISTALIWSAYGREQAAVDQAQENFKRAREAVDTYLTKVSEDRLLNQPGMQKLRKELLELALEYYQDFIKQHGDDPRLQAELADAYQRVAKVTRSIGSAQESLDSVQAAMAIYQTLLRDQPEAIDYQKRLSGLYQAQGELQLEFGRTDEALMSYRKAIKNGKNFPSVLAESFESLAGLQRACGQFDEAQTSLAKAVTIFEELSDQDPDNSESLDSLAEVYHNSAILHTDLDQFEKALVFCQKANIIREKLAERKPDVFKFGLAESYKSSAFVFNRLGRVKDAMAVCQKAIAIDEEEKVKNPDVVIYKVHLAGSYELLSGLHSKLGQNDQAISLQQRAIPIREEIAQTNPEVVDYQNQLAQSLIQQAILHRTTGEPTEALTSLRKAIAVNESLVLQVPDAAAFRHDLAVAYRLLAAIQRDIGQLDEALALYQKAIAVTKTFGEQHLESIGSSSDLLGNIYNSMAILEATRGKVEEALSSIQESVAIREKLVERTPDVPKYQSGLATAYYNRAAYQSQLGQAAEALVSYHKAITIMNNLVAHDRAMPEYRYVLANIHQGKAILLANWGRVNEALVSHELALKIRNSLVEQHSDNPKYQRDLAGSCRNVAMYWNHVDDSDKAIVLLENAITMAKRLAIEHPDFAIYRLDLARSYDSFAEVLRKVGRESDAKDLWQKCVALTMAVAEEDRTPGDWALLGRALYSLGRWQEACGALEMEIKVCGDAGPTIYNPHATWWYLTMTLCQLGELKRARSIYEQLVAQLEQTPLEYPQQRRHRAEVEELLGIEHQADKRSEHGEIVDDQSAAEVNESSIDDE